MRRGAAKKNGYRKEDHSACGDSKSTNANYPSSDFCRESAEIELLAELRGERPVQLIEAVSAT